MVWAYGENGWGCLAKRVMEAGVDGRKRRGRRSIGWMKGVKSALSARGVSVEAARVRARDKGEWRAIVMCLRDAWTHLCKAPSTR